MPIIIFRISNNILTNFVKSSLPSDTILKANSTEISGKHVFKKKCKLRFRLMLYSRCCVEVLNLEQNKKIGIWDKTCVKPSFSS